MKIHVGTDPHTAQVLDELRVALEAALAARPPWADGLGDNVLARLRPALSDAYEPLEIRLAALQSSTYDGDQRSQSAEKAQALASSEQRQALDRVERCLAAVVAATTGDHAWAKRADVDGAAAQTAAMLAAAESSAHDHVEITKAVQAELGRVTTALADMNAKEDALADEVARLRVSLSSLGTKVDAALARASVPWYRRLLGG
jgi:hypothetical protein